MPSQTKDNARKEPTEGEKELVKKWIKRIDDAMSHEKCGKLFGMFEARRKRLRGIKTHGGVQNEERTNLVYSTLASLEPQVYARNPDISVSPTEAVSGDRYETVRAFSKTMECVLSSQFVKGAKLKKRAKACVRSALTTSVGWAKLMYQRDVRADPLIQNRMNDVQDNIQRLNALIKRVDDPDQAQDVERNKLELEQQLKALQGQLEKVISEGLVIDHCLSEDVIILDDTVRSFDGYCQADAIAQRVWFTKEKYFQTFGYEPTKATEYRVRADTKEGTNNDSASNGDKNNSMYCAFEIWCMSDNTVYTVCRGEEGFCRAPYQPQKLGEHWYPFFPLGFNVVDGQFYPMSDVELLEKLSDEYNESRTQLEKHREDSRPVRFARSGGALTPEDLEKIQNRKTNEIVVLSGAGGRPLSDDIGEFTGVSFNPAIYDTSPIRGDMNLVSGSTDAAQGSVLKAKTATEAEYLQAGLASRTSERQDTIADWIGDMAEYASEILLQELTVPQVQRVAGMQAVWPAMTKDEALDQVSIEIRAGTMGKPDKAREQENWAKVLPLIQQGMMQVVQLRQQSLTDMADAAVELLRETLRRFDERIDVDKFIPPVNKDGTQDPQQAIMQAQQQLQQMQEQMQQQVEMAKAKLDEERAAIQEKAAMDKRAADLDKREAQLSIREEISKANEFVSAKVTDADKRVADAEAALETERTIAKAQEAARQSEEAALQVPTLESIRAETTAEMQAFVKRQAEFNEAMLAEIKELRRLSAGRQYIRDPKTNRIISSVPIMQ